MLINEYRMMECFSIPVSLTLAWRGEVYCPAIAGLNQKK